MSALEVVPSEAGGWDVVRTGDGMALSNHANRESAELAAKMRAEEEHTSASVNPDAVHGIDDDARGMRTAIIALAVLSAAVVILLIVLALTGSLTGFGSE
jgi:cell division protein FtsX